MGYYRGDYYRGDYYSRFRGDPGLFGSIGRLVGGVAKTVGGVVRNVPGVGGIVGTALNIGGGLLQRVSGGAPMVSQAAVPTIAPPGGGMMPALGPARAQPARKIGKGKIGISALGTLGFKPEKTRRMNAGNAKAARRAIRRIKSVRHLLQSIERELPHRRAVQRSMKVARR